MQKKVKVINETRNCVVLEQAAVADTIFSRMKGLLGLKKLAPGYGIVLKPANSVHTIGMKFAIDVAFIDREGKVLRVENNMSPGRMGLVVRRSYLVVETNAGELTKSETSAGDQLSLIEL